VEGKGKERQTIYCEEKRQEKKVQELLCYDFCIKEEGPEKEGGKKGYLTFRSR